MNLIVQVHHLIITTRNYLNLPLKFFLTDLLELTLSQVIKIENKGYDLIYSAIRPSSDNKFFFDEIINKYSLGHNYVDDHTKIKK